MTAITAKTVSEFMTFVQNTSPGRMEEMTSPEFISYLNQALVNRYAEIRRLVPSLYQGKATLSVGGFSVSLPTDYKHGQTCYLFQDANNESIDSLYPTTLYYTEGDSIKFNDSTTNTFYLKYYKNESYYSGSGESVAETKDSQAMHLLSEEIKALFFDAQFDNESNNASANSLNKANRIA